MVIAFLFFGVPILVCAWLISTRIKKYGWAGFKKKIRDSFFEFLRVSAWASLVIVYFSGFVTLASSTEMSPDLLALSLSTYIVAGIFLLYYCTGIKRRQTRSIRKIFSGDLAGIKSVFVEFLSDIGKLTAVLFAVAGWLLKLAFWLVLIGLGIWLLVALGPLWIIAIVLVFILLALVGR